MRTTFVHVSPIALVPCSKLLSFLLLSLPIHVAWWLIVWALLTLYCNLVRLS